MKKFFMISAVVIATLFAGCSSSDTDEGNTLEPNFPATVTPSVAAGEPYTLSFTPNLDWEISIPNEKMRWFWIGNYKDSSIRGKAGATATIEIHTAEKVEDDEEVTCDVTMTMGGQSRVIATITRTLADYEFTLYPCKVENDDFVFAEDSEENGFYFAYETTPAENITLIWPEGKTGFSFQVLVEANFKWGIKSKPEWLELSIVEGEPSAPVEVRLSGDNIVGGATGKLVFCNAYGRDTEFPYNIELPDCSTMFSISGINEESIFKGSGEYASITSIGTPSWMPEALATVTDIKGTQILVFEGTDNSFSPWVAAGADSWIETSLSAWDEKGGALQNRTLTIKAKANEGAERNGRVYAVPAAKVPESGKLPAFEYLVTTVCQLEAQEEMTVMTVNPKMFLDEGKVRFLRLDTNDKDLGALIPGVQIPEGFLLGYGADNSADYAELVVDREFTVKFYDAKYKEMTEDSWLTTIPTEDKKSLHILMNPSTDNDNGFAVLFDTTGAAFAMIRCEYTKSQGGDIGGEEYLSWVDASAVKGATLTRATKENVKDLISMFPALEDAGINEYVESVESYLGVYVLEYTTAAPTSAGINVAQFFMTQTYSGGEWLSVDDSQAPCIFVDMSAREAKGDLHWVDFYVGETMATIKSIKLFCIANF